MGLSGDEEREGRWMGRSEQEWRERGKAVCCLRGACPQGLAAPWDNKPVLLSQSFPVLLWVHLWDYLPEKLAAGRQMLCKRAREICYALSLSLEAVRYSQGVRRTQSHGPFPLCHWQSLWPLETHFLFSEPWFPQPEKQCWLLPFPLISWLISTSFQEGKFERGNKDFFWLHNSSRAKFI